MKINTFKVLYNPLKSFKGKKNRRILPLALGLLLALTPLAIYKATRPSRSDAAWFDDGWRYRQKITFGNTGSADTNKKVKFDIDTATLTTAKLQADCDDSRFTDVNGNPLPFYLDSGVGACDTSSTDYYVLMPTISQGTNTLYYYYGNPNAGNAGQTSQFSEGTFSPTSGPSLASEEKGVGPIAWWKLDEGVDNTCSGGTNDACDSTLNAFDAAKSSAPAWQGEEMCELGKCLRFDGTDDYLETTNEPLSGTTYTVSGWFRPADVTGSNVIFSQRSSTDSDSVMAQLYTSSSKASFITRGDDGANSAFATDTVNLTNSKWYHLTGVRNGSNVYIYLNGVQVGTDTDAGGTITTDTSLIGAAQNGVSGKTGFMKGSIDQVKIYDYARSALEIKNDYLLGSTSHGSSVVFGQVENTDRNLTDGLVMYLPLDENTANTCAGGSNDHCDKSGNTNDGAQASTAANGGRFGSAQIFNSSSDIITIADHASLDLTTNMTLSAWVYPTTLNTENMIFIKAVDSDTADRAYYIRVNSAGGTSMIVVQSTTENFAFASAAVTTNTWTHVVGTYDGSNIRIYTNGTLRNTTPLTGSANTNSGQIWVGRLANQGQEMWTGTLDELRVYNRALSASEVSQLYNWRPGLQASWNLDEGSGTSSVRDTSGYGLNATMNGSMTTDDWVAGRLGSALEFDGSNDSLSVSDNSNLDIFGNASMTLQAWIRHPVQTSGQDIILAKTSSAAGYKIIMEADGDITCGVDDDSTWTPDDAATSTAATYDDDLWHHVACIKDGDLDDLILFIDGVQITSDTSIVTADITNSNTFYIGIDGDGSSNAWLGQIDDVRVYGYARSQLQIIKDMNAGHPAPGSPIGSAVAQWHLDEGYGTTANDVTSNDNDLTLSSASWTNSGKYDKAWNGTNAVWMSRADDGDFDVGATEDYSISLWFKSDSASNPGAIEYLFNKANATTAGYAVYANTSGQICFGIDDDGSWGPDIASCTSDDFYDNTWHHALAVRDASISDSTLIYVDGLRRDSDADSTTATLANSLSLFVGDRDGTDNGDEFAGDVDEIRVYRLTITADQAKVALNQSKAGVFGANTNASGTAGDFSASREFCVPGDTGTCNSPVGEWKLDEKTGTSAFDTSTNGRTGTITSGTWKSAGSCKVGACLEFNGSSSVVDVGTGPTSVKSVSFWVYPETTTEYFINLTSTTDYIWVSGGTVTATGLTSPRIYVNGVLTTALAADNWQHVVVTTAVAENASNLDIGRTEDTNYLEGRIDSMQIGSISIRYDES